MQCAGQRKRIGQQFKRMAEIDLVILDMTMPGMGGRETFEKLKKSNPSLADTLNATIEKIKARPNPNLQILGVVITLHDKRTTLGRDIQNQIDEVFKGKVFKTTISKSIRLEESPAYKESIFTFAPRSSGALEYYSLTEEILSRV